MDRRGFLRVVPAAAVGAAAIQHIPAEAAPEPAPAPIPAIARTVTLGATWHVPYPQAWQDERDRLMIERLQRTEWYMDMVEARVRTLMTYGTPDLMQAAHQGFIPTT